MNYLLIFLYHANPHPVSVIFLFINYHQGKVQKHQAFEAEVAANEDRVTTTIKVGRGKAILILLYHLSTQNGSRIQHRIKSTRSINCYKEYEFVHLFLCYFKIII